MSVIILSAEISWRNCLGSLRKIRILMVRGLFARHLGSFTSKCGVLTHNVEKPMTRRASLSSFKNKSSKSNNAPREKAGPVQSKTIYGKRSLLSRRAQDLSLKIGQGSKPTQLGCQGMILCQRHVCYYFERGDLVEKLFGLIMKNKNFHGSGTFDKAFWEFHKQMLC